MNRDPKSGIGQSKSQLCGTAHLRYSCVVLCCVWIETALDSRFGHASWNDKAETDPYLGMMEDDAEEEEEEEDHAEDEEVGLQCVQVDPHLIPSCPEVDISDSIGGQGWQFIASCCTRIQNTGVRIDTYRPIQIHSSLYTLP